MHSKAKINKAPSLRIPTRQLLSGLILALLCSLVLGTGLQAVLAEGAVPESRQRIYDQAEVLDPSQAEKINQALAQLAESYGQEVIVVTTKDLKGREARDYADLFYYDLYPDPDQPGALILFAVKQELYIMTSGTMIDIVTDADVESLLDQGWDAFVLSDYAQSSMNIIGGIKELLDRGLVAGHQRMDEADRFGLAEKPKSISTLDALLALGVSAISGLGFVGATKQSYRPQTRKPSYRVEDNSLLHLTQNVNTLVNKRIRMIPLPPPSSSSSSSYNPHTTSTTHTGPSGSTRGGGGRKL